LTSRCTPDVEQSRRDLLELYEEGYRSVAICLVHSYTFQQHEHLLASLAQEIGFEHVSVSSQLQSMIKIVNRGTSATADAYLTPEIKRYIAGFAKVRPCVCRRPI
jgi:5-oxoprolinase (ATP-hydrolysing)